MSCLPFSELTFIDDVEVLQIVLVSTNDTLNMVLENLLESSWVGDAGHPGRGLCDRVTKQLAEILIPKIRSKLTWESQQML